MGAEIFHADGKTAMTNLIVVLRNFTNTPENSDFHCRECIYVPRGFLPEQHQPVCL